MGFDGFIRLFISLLSLIALFDYSLATRACDFPAIFNFGDSNSDTGGLVSSALVDAGHLPNGETFFHMPSGRFSDGRLIIDFIAESFGLPRLNAYLDSIGSNFTTGANFATAASSIVPKPNVFPLGGYSPFSLDVQYRQFMQLKYQSHFFNKQGGVFGHLLPNDDYFSKALYTFDIGQNDIGAGFFSPISISVVKASIPDAVNNFSMIVKNVYKQGGRTFWIHNTGPIGCLPYIFVNLPVKPSQMDKAGCSIPYNELAQDFNKMLKEAVIQLRKGLPSASITYVDIYSAKYTLISQAEKFGFKSPLVACCGFGGEFNYNPAVNCGGTTNINGTRVFGESCHEASVRVNWDGVHYTEAANKWIYNQIVDGAFSDPPNSLRMVCQNKHAK